MHFVGIRVRFLAERQTEMHNLLDMPPPVMTVAEFLDWAGDGSGRTFQLVDGEVQAVSPSRPTHGTIQM